MEFGDIDDRHHSELRLSVADLLQLRGHHDGDVVNVLLRENGLANFFLEVFGVDDNVIGGEVAVAGLHLEAALRLAGPGGWCAQFLEIVVNCVAKRTSAQTDVNSSNLQAVSIAGSSEKVLVDE
jgi:hypothetical protein